MIKNTHHLGIERDYLNIIEAVYGKLTGNFILCDKTLKTFPLRSGTRQEILLLPFLFNIVLEVLARPIRSKMKQKAFIMLPASKDLLYLFTNWVFFKMHFSYQAMRKPARTCKFEVLCVVSL